METQISVGDSPLCRLLLIFGVVSDGFPSINLLGREYRLQ
jgi:hypothetical protein